MSTSLALAADPTPESLILRAIESNVPVESLERLLAMRQTLKAESAKEAFFTALSAFQADCPVIEKKKTVRGEKYSYNYAPLEDIVRTVAPLLREHGLSYSFDTAFEDSPAAMVVICTVHQTLGHSETSSFRTPVDSGARMNVMQQSAAAQTYAKRYAFCNAFGILTGDEDNDGKTPPAPNAYKPAAGGQQTRATAAHPEETKDSPASAAAPTPSIDALYKEALELATTLWLRENPADEKADAEAGALARLDKAVQDKWGVTLDKLNYTNLEKVVLSYRVKVTADI